MTRVIEILPAGGWDVAQATDVFAADYEGRHRRRMMLGLRSGEKVLLELEHARLLQAGDGLKLDDGRIVRVEALPEKLMEVTAHDPLHLMRLAWHLGNRHLPAAIDAQRILVRQDHVIADMIRGLGGHVHEVEAPFDPESGAYTARAASHDHAHGEEHHHHHGHGHSHSHD
ncbi:urease accessory protein UreE [Acetobacter estunensis NRIC 0472]|uniref:Urease accessory protein UreE n=1 Tax=Acetobacter estunensis TaxID=104097 RepID=A0A967EBA3_9PROT|nr:urease accessory protein UreE [Acetobacter estunensis]NHO53258.1 urease accessory protein UreE [Acetobacter estunensis]GBQ23666.1 urease accessory protein UreE [Acetobacter estunensis NRIC 0472]